jgi:hypothetical protein
MQDLVGADNIRWPFKKLTEDDQLQTLNVGVLAHAFGAAFECHAAGSARTGYSSFACCPACGVIRHY